MFSRLKELLDFPVLPPDPTMFSSKLASLVAVATALPSAFAVHVIFGGTQPVVRTRLDPIVTPGVVSVLVIAPKSRC